ncbi:hypothetical protein [Geobacter sp. SVR]|uniref:hypothetical protein n=1 Tax=Geobacter sp. SVR TaxID=2495594 RepID=UPI00143EF579|nr:hypothetical protein [Geobacter sp. SVR]BCS54194.1 hypothetical protein GSVR_25020 [Geobacter sp. SVR]GCF85947.1 hypothetical protein GSbR_25470 [Geobacter sp. SVR]
MKLIIAIILLTAATVCAEEGSWQAYSESQDGCTYFVDTSSIKPLTNGWTQVNDGCLCEDGRVVLATKRIDTVNHRFMLDRAIDVVNKVNYGPSKETYQIIPGTVVEVLEHLLRAVVEKDKPTI